MTEGSDNEEKFEIAFCEILSLKHGSLNFS